MVFELRCETALGNCTAEAQRPQRKWNEPNVVDNLK